ncbi:MAG: tyrosine-type recombinase/integrase [Sedimenticola sp.]
MIFVHLSGVNRVMIRLMYGTGMRIMECVRLRILDLDFDYRHIAIREGKGKKDRVVPMPETLIDDLQKQIRFVTQLHEKDMEAGFGSVFLPDALARKFPTAEKSCAGNTCFPPAVLLRILAPVFGGVIMSTRQLSGSG